MTVATDGLADVPDDAERVLVDVNALAIGLVDDHPGHEFVEPWFAAGFGGEFVLSVFDYHPFRAQYVMTTNFAVDTVAARNAVQSLLAQPVEIVSAALETLLAAYEISAAKNHDVYDCFLISLARHHDADCLLTTDTDFATLCEDESVAYANPVPESVRRQFDAVSG